MRSFMPLRQQVVERPQPIDEGQEKFVELSDNFACLIFCEQFDLGTAGHVLLQRVVCTLTFFSQITVVYS
jgi:hypothetical protein